VIALREAECCALAGTDCRPSPLRRRASRPQLKRDPLDGPPMSRTLLAHLLLVMVLGAPLSAQVRPADTLDSSRRCLFTRGRRESTSEFLRRCAEDFVARNGYTSAPPTSDSTLWSPESIEFASSWQEVFQRRHNRLMPKAESAGCNRGGCAATFRYADPSIRCVVRVVTMSKTGSGMRMEHQEAVPRPGSAEERKCRNG